MIRIQSPTDEYIQHSFQGDLLSQSSANEEHQSGYYIATPSKTNKKPNKQNTSKSNIQNQSNGSVSNASVFKQVMRKDQELDEFRQQNMRLQDKLNDLEFLLNKAAEEIRRKNEDQHNYDNQVSQLRQELNQRELQIENQQKTTMQNDPHLKQMWERGAFLESQNEALRQQIITLEQELMQKLDTLQQTQIFVEKVQVDYIKQQEDLKVKTKQIKKLKAKNKLLKDKDEIMDQKEKLISALKMEIDNQREDMKELLKEKIEQERLIKRQNTGPKYQDSQDYQTLQQQILFTQNQYQLEMNLNKQLSQKISSLQSQQTQEVSLQSEDQVIILELEVERLRVLVKDNEIKYNNQLNSLRQEANKQQGFGGFNPSQQTMRNEMINSRSQSSQPKQGFSQNPLIPGLNLRSSVALEEAEIFLSEERGKIYSSRLGTQRPQLKKLHMNVTSHLQKCQTEASNHSDNEPLTWVLTLPVVQLQEELYKSLERETEVETQLESLHLRLLDGTNKKLTVSQKQLPELQSKFDQLFIFVEQLHEQLWVEQNKNQIFKDMINDLKSYQKFLKSQLVEFNFMFKSLNPTDNTIGSVEDYRIQNTLKIEEFEQYYDKLIKLFKKQKVTHDEQLKRNNDSMELKEKEFVTQKDKAVLYNNQQNSIQNEQLITELKNKFENQSVHSQQHVLELEQQVVNLKTQIQQIQKDAQEAQINNQREKQEIYRSWELDQGQINGKLSKVEIEKKNLSSEYQQKLDDLQRQLNKSEESKRQAMERMQTLTDNYDSEASLNSLQRTPLSNKNCYNTQQNDLDTAIKHYKFKAKEQLQRRVSELETVLCYVNELILGFKYETSSYRVNSLQVPENNQQTEYQRDKIINSIKRLEQKNPTLVDFIQQMKNNIDELYEQGLQFKVRFLNFLNSSVVQIISQNSQCCESLIRDNHEVQVSLNWLLEAGKHDGESEYLRDDKFIFDNAETLWGELVTRCLSARELVHYESSEMSSFLQSEAQIQSPTNQQTFFGMTTTCSVPELSEIMDLQMKVVCNLLSALTTICGSQKNNTSLVPSPNNHINSGTSLLSNEWLSSLRPSLDQTTQIVKALAPAYYKLDDQQQQLDSFIQRAFSSLSTLNKKLNDLPPNFFNSLTLQHNSLTHCVLNFVNCVGQTRQNGDEHQLVNNFNDQLKDMSDTMSMFSLYLVEACNQFTSPNLVKDLTTTFIVHLHRKEIKSTQSEFLKRTVKSNSTSTNHGQRQDQYYLLEELASFFSQLSFHLSL